LCQRVLRGFFTSTLESDSLSKLSIVSSAHPLLLQLLLLLATMVAIPLDLLDDLCTRFLLNVPAHELE